MVYTPSSPNVGKAGGGEGGGTICGGGGGTGEAACASAMSSVAVDVNATTGNDRADKDEDDDDSDRPNDWALCLVERGALLSHAMEGVASNSAVRTIEATVMSMGEGLEEEELQQELEGALEGGMIFLCFGSSIFTIDLFGFNGGFFNENSKALEEGDTVCNQNGDSEERRNNTARKEEEKRK